MTTLRRALSRLSGLFQRHALDRRMKQEMEEHVERMTEDNVSAGMPAEEARRQALLKFGSVESIKEDWRDQRGLPRIEALVSDVVFGLRQLRKDGATTAAAILSLALAIGSTTAAFRLVDAVLLRSLPVAEPERLFYVANTYLDREGRGDTRDDFDYPTFRRYREALAGSAESLVVGSVASRQEITISGASESERVYRQFVSGNLFPVFGLRPALGRLLSPSDDLKPGGHPVAVLSHSFWDRRFNRDQSVIGKTLRTSKTVYEIVGVAPEGFVGSEPGEMVDIFLPAMMNVEAIESAGWSWFRMWVQPNRGVTPEQIRQTLQAVFTNDHLQRVKEFHSDTPKQAIDAFLNEKILVLPAGSGVSRLQKQYRRPLIILSLLVGMVLLLATVNVAHILSAQTTARAREMALRVSIGAGRGRLIQLLLVQSALLSIAASALGAVFAAIAAPVVVSMLRVPRDPVRLVLETGLRELLFSALLATLVAVVFGLGPALRASGLQPVSALRGGGGQRSSKRFTRIMVGAQVAFCVIVLFVSGLFIQTFTRLANRPLGFSPSNVLVMDVSASKQHDSAVWAQATDAVRGLPGVQATALAGWPLLSMNRWSGSVRLPGRVVEVRQTNFLDVSAGFFDTMRIGMIDGRDFRLGDVPPPRQTSDLARGSGVGIVNEAFARAYFDGQNPVGRSVEVRHAKDVSTSMEIVGLVRNAAYYNLRDPMPPTVYVPMQQRGHVTLLAQTAGDPLELAPTLRDEVSRVRPDFQIVQTQTQNDFVRWHLVREKLLASLSLFFAIVALVLAATGLYGVLSYSVNKQRKEIGICMALGARSSHVVLRVVIDIGLMICIGSALGIVGSVMSGSLVESLLFEVKASDVSAVAIPIAVFACIAVAAGLIPAARAVRIDPARTLRSE